VSASRNLRPFGHERLVIEVDGGAHRGRGAADARRDRKLAKLGFALRLVLCDSG
jgi:very-short-patch-repair endonuclease